MPLRMLIFEREREGLIFGILRHHCMDIHENLDLYMVGSK